MVPVHTTTHEIPKEDDVSAVHTYKTRSQALKPGKLYYPLTPDNNFEPPPRVPECTDHAETSTNVSSRCSPAGILGVLLTSILTKRKVGKSTKI